LAPISTGLSRGVVSYHPRLARSSANGRRKFARSYASPVDWPLNTLARAVDTLSGETPTPQNMMENVTVHRDVNRDVKFLTTLPDERDRRYGEALQLALKGLFAVFHQREQLDEGAWQTQLQAARDRVLDVGLAGPATQHGQNLVKRFRDHGAAYFQFVTTPGIEPTNNLAEQAIRFVVIAGTSRRGRGARADGVFANGCGR
jgi:hypothetical protein